MKLTALFVLAAGFCAASVQADTLHAVGDGAYWHHDSGWIFPERIHELVRTGMPQDVAGSTDVVVYYADTDKRGIKASLSVYAKDSAIHPTSLVTAKQLYAESLGSNAVVAESDFVLKDGPAAATATRIVYRTRGADDAPCTALYFVATPEWIVMITIVVPSHAKDLPLADAFVRAQHWDRLGQATPPTSAAARL